MPILTFLNRIFRSSLHFLLVLVFLFGIVGTVGDIKVKASVDEFNGIFLITGTDLANCDKTKKECKIGTIRYVQCEETVSTTPTIQCGSKVDDKGVVTTNNQDAKYESNGYKCTLIKGDGNKIVTFNDCTKNGAKVSRVSDICAGIEQAGTLKMNCDSFAIVFKKGSDPDSLVSWDFGNCYAVKTTSGQNKCISNSEIQNACKGAWISTSLQRTLNGWIGKEATCDTVTYQEFKQNLGANFADISVNGIGGATNANVVTGFDPSKCRDLTPEEKIEAEKKDKFKTLAEGEKLQNCAGQIVKKSKNGSFEAGDGTKYNSSGNVQTVAGDGDKGGGGVNAVFGMLYKIVLMIILIIMIVVQMVQMLILLLLTNITAVLFNLSPNAPFLTAIAVPLSITFANLANLIMGFLFILTGSQAMMGLIKVKQAIDRCIQLAIYVIVSNFVYQGLAFIISVVDGFAQLVIKVFAGGDIVKLFYGLFSQFASISELRESGSIFPDLGKSGAAIGGAFSQPEGLYTALVMKEAIIIIMFLVMLWIFKDIFVLVLTRSTILLLFLITSPILALAFLVKDLLPSSLQKQIGDLPNQIFTAISFNLTFVIALVLCFRITQVTQESFKSALKTNTALGGTAPGTTATAMLDTFGGTVTGSAQAASGLSQAANGLMVSVISIVPVFIALCILYFIVRFYNETYFPVAKQAMSSIGQGASGMMQDFMKAKNFREGMGNLASGVLSTASNAATGQRGNEVNFAKDGIGAGMKSTAMGLKIASKLPETVVKAPGRLASGLGGIVGKVGDITTKTGQSMGASSRRFAMLKDSNRTSKASLDTAYSTAQAAYNSADSEVKIARDQAVSYAQSQGFADKNGNVNTALMPIYIRDQYDAFKLNQTSKEAALTSAQGAMTIAQSNLSTFNERITSGMAKGVTRAGEGVSTKGESIDNLGNRINNSKFVEGVTAVQDNSPLAVAGAIGDAKFMNEPQNNQSRIVNAVSGDDGQTQKDKVKQALSGAKEEYDIISTDSTGKYDRLDVLRAKNKVIELEGTLKGLK